MKFENFPGFSAYDIFVKGTPIDVIDQSVASGAAVRQKPRPQEIHLAPETKRS